MKVNIKKRLERIYKAKDCTDLSDVHYALKAATELLHEVEKSGQSQRAVLIRITGLLRMEKRFS